MSSQTNVKEVFYNEQENLITVVYGSGASHQYHPANPEDFQHMMSSECLAKAVHEFVRGGAVVGVKQVGN